uniref:Uncharacterized protein n=1 Tax=Anguilla anguilla TaxID=7936 RepID=A0A0E9QGE3_ANGAN
MFLFLFFKFFMFIILCH